MNVSANFSQEFRPPEGPGVPVWAQDSGGLIANSDMLAIGATLLVVIVIKTAAMIWRR